MFKFVGFIKWTGLILGLFGVGIAGYMINENARTKNSATNVVPVYMEPQNIPTLTDKDMKNEVNIDKSD